MKKILKNRNFLAVFLSILILFILLLSNFFLRPLNDNLNSFILSFKNSILVNDTSNKNLISNDIVVVTIDEKTLEKLGLFPFSRSHYKTLIENINSGGAEIIGLDIIFADNNFQDSEGDLLFAEAIENAGNIVLGSATISKSFDGVNLGIIEKPLDIFLNGALSYGYFSPNVNRYTNIVTSFSPSMKIHDSEKNLGNYNHFSISVLKAYFSKIYRQDFLSYEFRDNDWYYIKPDYKVPFSRYGSNEILINFLPIPSSEQGRYSNIEYYSFIDVYENKINPEVFNGKIVLVGVTAKGIKDIFITPNGVEYGVFVLANIINSILTGNNLLYLEKNIEFLLIFLLIVLSIYFNLSRSGFVLISSNVSVCVIFLLIFPVFISVFTPYLLNYFSHLIFALIISLTLSNILKYFIENKNKNKLNKALSEYVSKAIADEILSNSGKINLDGEKKKLAIYFSDIEGFTSISEKFEPEDLVKFLREYLSSMSDVIMDSSGFINKYEGDAIMALWGAFIDYDNGGYHACYSAIKQQELLDELNKKWSKEGFDTIKTRIGIHVGEAIVGNIGSAGRKMEFTALGDSVNLASRLEGVNKFYGTYICVSEDVFMENSQNFEFRYLDIIKVKGKDKPIKIYELITFKGKLSEEKKEIIELFDKAVNLYINRDFKGAKKIFFDLSAIGDRPSSTYLDMCEIYIKNPPSDDWDGISVMQSK